MMSYLYLDYCYLIIILVITSIMGIVHNNKIRNNIRIHNLTALGFLYNSILVLNLSTWEMEGSLIHLMLIIITFLLAGYLILPDLTKTDRFEVPLLITLSLFALHVMVDTTDLIVIFLALELQGFVSYTLVGINRESLHATEGALKYFLTGSLASALFILGVSYLYGYTSVTDLIVISDLIDPSEYTVEILIGSHLIICALLIKVGAVPFHFWLPDVYEGAPAYILLYLIVFPKIFLFYLLFVINEIFNLSNIIIISLALTILVSSVLGIGETKIKRFIAYTGIFNNAGFLSVTLGSGYLALSLFIIALILYVCVTSLIILPLFSTPVIKTRSLSNLHDLRGLTSANPALAFIVLFGFLSSAGLPPFIGFWSKISVLGALFEKNQILIPIVLILTSLIPAYYYIRFTSRMLFHPKKQPLFLRPLSTKVAMSLSVFFYLTICFTFFPPEALLIILFES